MHLQYECIHNMNIIIFASSFSFGMFYIPHAHSQFMASTFTKQNLNTIGDCSLHKHKYRKEELSKIQVAVNFAVST